MTAEEREALIREVHSDVIKAYLGERDPENDRTPAQACHWVVQRMLERHGDNIDVLLTAMMMDRVSVVIKDHADHLREQIVRALEEHVGDALQETEPTAESPPVLPEGASVAPA